MEKLLDPADRRHESRRDGDDIHQAALLIDFDNVTMGIRSNLGQELRNLLNSEVIRGKVAVQRAYADWRRYPQYIVPLSEASIDLIFAPAYGSSKKNATDIRLAIDALELVFIRPEIRTYILMSGDSDFSSLVLKLKEYGKYVIGVGIQESSSDLLVQNCDEYYSYTALSGLSKTGDQPVESHDPWVLVEKAVGKMVERGDTMRSDRLKQVMLEIDPTFNEKEQGFSKFNRFVVEAASKDLLSIQKMENGQYGVAPAGVSVKRGGEEKPKKEEGRGRRGEERRGRGRPKDREHGHAQEDRGTRRARAKLTMDSALTLLSGALDSLLETGNDSVRDSDVKRKMLEIDPHFDEGELGFSKFSKFLQAAEEKSVVVLERGPNGNYHVSRPKRKRTARKRRQEADAEGGTAESKMQRLARFFFGSGVEEQGREVPQQPEAVQGAVSQSDTSARSKDERSGREAATSQRGRRGGRSARGGGERSTATRGRRAVHGGGSAARTEGARGQTRRGGRGSEARGGPDRRRGAERSRGERRERPQAAEEERVERSTAERTRESVREEGRRDPERGYEERRVEPVAPQEMREETSQRAPTSSVVAEAGSADHAGEGKSGVTPAPLPGAPRGTIRGRWGTRGRYRPSAAPPPIFEGQKLGATGTERSPEPQPSGEPEGSGVAEDDVSAVKARLRQYSGVGHRTAEALVDAFGSDLFRVMDEEPDRIRAVLPDHRAERVLEARRREVEAGGE